MKASTTGETMSFQNQTVIVTGSNSGIGLGIAQAFHTRGANVVLTGRDATKLDRVASSFGSTDRIATVTGDIGHKDTGDRLTQVATERFGRVDLLVNNAGTFAPKPFLDVTEEELDGYLTGNLRGTYFTTQAAVRQMVHQGKGSVINIGTVIVQHAVGGFPCSAPMASKGGIHALTINWAAELGSKGIRVNLVAPGVIRSPIYGGANVDDFGGLALVNRVGEVDEIAEAVIYLHQAEFVTGHILNVAGGFVTGRP